MEGAFRTLEGMDLITPARFTRVEALVQPHIFLCLLAYYVDWHRRQALAPLLFGDESLPEERKRRGPVAPA